MLSARLGPTRTKAPLQLTWMIRGLGRQNPDPTRGRPKPMAKSSALPGHWPSQWLTRPLGSSLGHWPSEPSSSSLGQWPSEPSSHPGSSLGHWPSEPSSSLLGQWPSEPSSRPGSSLGHWPSEPSSSSLGQWSSEPQPAQAFHSANGRVNLTTMFTRPLADPASSNADPSILTRPRGLQTTPWLPINTKAPPLVQVIHS